MNPLSTNHFSNQYGTEDFFMGLSPISDDLDFLSDESRHLFSYPNSPEDSSMPRETEVPSLLEETAEKSLIQDTNFEMEDFSFLKFGDAQKSVYGNPERLLTEDIPCLPLKIRKLTHNTSNEQIPSLLATRMKLNLSISNEAIPKVINAEAQLNDPGLKREIEASVTHFLFPYIANRITKANELPRDPFFLQLIADFNSKYDKEYITKNVDKIQSCAVEFYIQCAARGLYTNEYLECNLKKVCMDNKGVLKPLPVTKPVHPDTIDYNSRFNIKYNDLTLNQKVELDSDAEYIELKKWYIQWNNQGFFDSYTKQVLILLNALAPALERDFPGFKQNPNQICDKVVKILKRVQYKKIEQHKERLIDYQMEEKKRFQDEMNVISAKTRYRQMQEAHLEAYLVKAVSALPDDEKVLYLADLSPEDQERMLADEFYKMMASEAREFFEQYFGQEILFPLTKEAYQFLIEGVEDVLGEFDKSALTLDAVLRIADNVYNVDWE